MWLFWDLVLIIVRSKIASKNDLSKSNKLTVMLISILDIWVFGRNKIKKKSWLLKRHKHRESLITDWVNRGMKWNIKHMSSRNKKIDKSSISICRVKKKILNKKKKSLQDMEWLWWLFYFLNLNSRIEGNPGKLVDVETNLRHLARQIFLSTNTQKHHTIQIPANPSSITYYSLNLIFFFFSKFFFFCHLIKIVQ